MNSTEELSSLDNTDFLAWMLGFPHLPPFSNSATPPCSEPCPVKTTTRRVGTREEYMNELQEDGVVGVFFPPLVLKTQ